MPRHLATFKTLPSCWVHERKHKVAKKYGAFASNTAQYDRSLLLEVLGHNMAELQEEGLFSTDARLHKAGKASKKLKAFLAEHLGEEAVEVSTCVVAHLSPAGQCHRGDVVVFKHTMQLAQVYFHASFNGQQLSLVSFWSIEKYEHGKGSCLCKKQHAPMLVATSEIGSSCVHALLQEPLYRVLIPLPYRAGESKSHSSR